MQETCAIKFEELREKLVVNPIHLRNNNISNWLQNLFYLRYLLKLTLLVTMRTEVRKKNMNMSKAARAPVLQNFKE